MISDNVTLRENAMAVRHEKKQRPHRNILDIIAPGIYIFCYPESSSYHRWRLVQWWWYNCIRPFTGEDIPLRTQLIVIYILEIHDLLLIQWMILYMTHACWKLY